MSDIDARLWPPWLRINRILRAMLHDRWSAEAWAQVKNEFKKALAVRSQIRRAGWFNCSTDSRAQTVVMKAALVVALVLVASPILALDEDLTKHVTIAGLGFLHYPSRCRGRRRRAGRTPPRSRSRSSG
jgi:hypothetical protein